MPDFLEFTFGDSTVKIATDRLYNSDGVWAMAADGHVRVGVSDYVQQRVGDLAYADVLPPGRQLVAGEPVATIETLKARVDVPCPLSGTIVEINETLDFEADIVNEDPYGAGWMAVLTATDWSADSALLLSPPDYLAVIEAEVRRESGDL